MNPARLILSAIFICSTLIVPISGAFAQGLSSSPQMLELTEGGGVILR